MKRLPGQVAAQAFDELVGSSARFPAGVFLLGARLDDLPRALRALDVRERLSLPALLAPTPPRWIYLSGFSIAARPVSNAEYLRFVEDPGYEDPARWQRVYEENALDEIERIDAGGAVARESYAGARSYLAALVRSLLFEVERGLGAPRGPELAWTFALAARALGPYLPADHRAALGAEERERLASLDVELSLPGTGGPLVRQALEALDAVIGRLRDAAIVELRETGTAPSPELERCLHERDYAAPELPIVALKLLDRLRAAIGRGRELRVPLRQLVYPLAWRDPEPRPTASDRPDRLAWAERPVTGVSLYEALAYADWLTRASGGRALVRLPSEAQLERVASWPVLPQETTADGRVRELAHPGWKRLFPWEERLVEDPAVPAKPVQTFERLARELAQQPLAGDTARVRELVAATAAPAGERPVEMLLGFQWEWTRDRLSESEPGYAHLDRAEPLGPEHEAWLVPELRGAGEPPRAASSRIGEPLGFGGSPAIGGHAGVASGQAAGGQAPGGQAPGGQAPGGQAPGRQPTGAPATGAGRLQPPPVEEKPLRAVRYASSPRPSAPFAARGGPSRIAGTPLATRRFGFDPLRGNLEVGFRVVLESAESREVRP